MSQAAAIRRRKQAVNGYKHLPRLGRSTYPTAVVTPKNAKGRGK